jgi:transposase-like protein
MGPAKLDVDVGEGTAGEVAKLMAVIAEHWPQAKVFGMITVALGGVLAAECRHPEAPPPEAPPANGSGFGPSHEAPNPSPLSRPARRARRQFTAEEKRAAVAAIAEHGIAATSKRLEISQSVLRGWKNRSGRSGTVPVPARPGQPSAAALVDKIRRDTATIETQRAAPVRNGPKASMVPSGVHHPVDHDAIRASAYPREDQ